MTAYTTRSSSLGTLAMLLVQNLISATEQLWANKLRSFLTVLGIVIGVMSTVVVVAAVQGYSNYIAGFLREMGTNAIWVHPGRPPGFHQTIGRTELILADIEEVDQSCPAINRTSPYIVREATVKYRDKDAKAEIQGCSPELQHIRNFFVEIGRSFGPVDIRNRSAVCVVGREVLRNLEVDEGI